MTVASALTARDREAAGAKRFARLAQCRREGHVWWPLDEPGDVSDPPAMACCLRCSRLQTLASTMR